MHEASFYSQLEDQKVQCCLCPHHCIVREGKHGICLTRENHEGKFYSENYCKPISTAIDPIEKKPLYHFYPGSSIFSTGPNGCTLKCDFCQNFEISQHILSPRELDPAELYSTIIKSKTKGVAYTYSEPYIWFETIMDIGPKIKEAGLINVMVTNGYMEPEPLNQLTTVIDAMNIDIKSMSSQFYKELCKGELEPVLRTCVAVKKHCHLEITNLLITGKNDSDENVYKLVNFIADNLGKDTPLHISRYFPRYKLNAEPTNENVLYRAWEIASESLDYVYLGNVHSKDKSSTFCPSCKTLLINRSGYNTVLTKDLKIETDKKCYCVTCDAAINIVF